MENSPSDASFNISPSENFDVISESVEYVVPQREEICFGMVCSNSWLIHDRILTYFSDLRFLSPTP
jgi:hypothetical protein